MEAALRRVSIERGHDPRSATLVAFSNAGRLHACALATALDCEAVVFPLEAGVLSALGALAGGSRRERSLSVLLEARSRAALERSFVRLERAVRAEFAAGERGAVTLERWCQARYVGQSHELEIRWSADLPARFHREHARRFGFAEHEGTVEVVTVEVRGARPGERPPASTHRDRAARSTRARVWEGGAWLEAEVHPGAALGASSRLEGPAIVAEDGATLWIARGWSARLHRAGALVLRRGSAR
jgi:N-methylhydantoinase A